MGLFSEYPFINYSDMNLSWVIELVKLLDGKVDGFSEWQNAHIAEYEELKKLHDRIVKGDFPESVKNAFYNWMRKNAIDIVGTLAKSVFFELTESGYFVAYIPDSWDEITFKTTGLDVVVPDVAFGHLVLAY